MLPKNKIVKKIIYNSRKNKFSFNVENDMETN